MSEETERLKLELAMAQLKVREQERLDRVEARIKREARLDAVEQRRAQRALDRTPEAKEARLVAEKAALRAKAVSDRLKAGARYVLAWGHNGPCLVLMEPPIPPQFADRTTDQLTSAEKHMTWQEFMALTEQSLNSAYSTADVKRMTDDLLKQEK